MIKVNLDLEDNQALVKGDQLYNEYLITSHLILHL